MESLSLFRNLSKRSDRPDLDQTGIDSVPEASLDSSGCLTGRVALSGRETDCFKQWQVLMVKNFD